MKLKKFIMRLFNKSYFYRLIAYHIQKWCVNLNPMLEINRYYIPVFGKKPDLDNPKNLVEKIYWMQLHCDLSLWSLYADKYRMRDYVKECGYEQNLPKLYNVWHTIDDFTEQEWNELPKQFVLKANNGCGTVMVIKDKNKHNFKKVRNTLAHWLAIPYGYRGFQPHYLGIKPCLFAEELLMQDQELVRLSPESMVDFKVWCFNGKPECILVTYNRLNGSYNRNLYDTNWNRMYSELNVRNSVEIDENIIFPRPVCLDEMLQIASRMSIGQPQMRVDFYIVNKKPIIGELTMAAGFGSFTSNYYDYLGTLTDLSLMHRIR